MGPGTDAAFPGQAPSPPRRRCSSLRGMRPELGQAQRAPSLGVEPARQHLLPDLFRDLLFIAALHGESALRGAINSCPHGWQRARGWGAAGALLPAGTMGWGTVPSPAGAPRWCHGGPAWPQEEATGRSGRGALSVVPTWVLMASSLTRTN